jgi:hypothetical protein
MVREFIFRNATKNMLRYAEIPQELHDTPDMSGTIYVYKSLFEGKAPQRIRVTVEAVSS